MIEFDMEGFGKGKGIGAGEDYKFLGFGLEREVLEAEHQTMLVDCAGSDSQDFSWVGVFANGARTLQALYGVATGKVNPCQHRGG